MLKTWLIIFTPIYIGKYKIFKHVRKYTDFISVGIDFIALNILLIIIDVFTVSNRYANNHWYLKIAFPITLLTYLFLNILMAVRFLKLNRLLKTSIILFIINFLYLAIPFIKVKNVRLQKEINNANIFKANFLNWETSIEQNIGIINFFLQSYIFYCYKWYS